MASTREERLQMRQRGAGRKIKDVDFGFSFGTAVPGPSASAGSSLFPEPDKASQIRPALKIATPPPVNASSQVESHSTPISQRRPTSARNNLPPRPSPYDLPPDDRNEEPRSNKRRRIEKATYVLSQNTAGSPDSEPKTAPSGNTATTERLASQSPEVLAAADASLIAAEALAVQSELLISDSPAIERVQTEVPNTTAIETGPLRKSHSPLIAKATKATQPYKARALKEILRTSTSPISSRIAKQKASKSKSKAKNQGSPVDSGLATSTSDHEPDQSSSGPTVERQAPSQPTVTEESVPVEIERSELDTAQIDTVSQPKRGRGKPSLAGKQTKTVTVESEKESQVSPMASTVGPPARPPRQARRVKKSMGQEPEPESPKESEAILQPESAKARARPNKKDKRPVAGPELEPELPTEPGPSTSRDRQRSNKRPAAEAATAVEPGTQAGPVPKARRRPANKVKSTSTSEATSRAEPEEEQSEETAAETQPQRKPKTRQPRGETVPVTVYRLANTSALGATYNSAGSGDEESADEISTRQKTKLPSRGGVNPADVLGQICRETLEKTLTTLQDGIFKETNPTRRAEWTRKRKAVEAFGSELDSRLLDLSEMLDSNFVLSMQLKKSKRDMMDLRTHLYQIRRERESIALQMDNVRIKHMEEEKTKTARNTINNSLHSLELALDRSQNRALPVEPATTEVEFMLRSLADDVSSQAGTQGGLLNQIRAFNAQLESTARRLER